MQLTEKSLVQNKDALIKAGIKLPEYDREQIRAATLEEPIWIHFGAGNIFRAFPAAVQQKLLEQGLCDKGIIVAEGYDCEIIDVMNRPHDDLSLLVTLKSDGSIEKTVIGSIVESLKADSDDEKEFSRLKEIFAAPSLQMVSFTITEKGYNLTVADGSVLPAVEKDFNDGPNRPESYIGKLSSLLYYRYINSACPVTLVSMDNCSHNGTRLFEAVSTFAKEWEARSLVQKGFLAWIEDPKKVSFPWSMIDKITPRPDQGVKKMLNDLGFMDTEGIVTQKNTYVAPFVNAEETEYLVIEDAFTNGRPLLEKGGVIFTNREVVDKVEKMKVCTCLNPLHTAMSIYGCLLGYEKISDEMKDADIVKLIKTVGYKEGLPVVVNPGILDPKEFIDTVINVRLCNPFMPDTPQRIMMDTSQKLPIRFGETIKAYQNKNDLDVQSLVAIPLVLAGWCRYLLGIDDSGKPFTPSPDPMLESLSKQLAEIKLGSADRISETLKPILSNENIFGVDLYKVGLGDRIEAIFEDLSRGEGAVRSTLQKHLANA